MVRFMTATALALTGTMLWAGPAPAAEQPRGQVVAQAPAESPSAGRTLREDLGAMGDKDTQVEAVESRLLAAGLGAIGGVVLFNFAMGGTAALPFMAEAMPAAGSGITAVSASTGAVAVSRVYAVSSAVGGALVGDYIYRRAQANRMPSVPRPVADRVIPQ
ncbi:MAG: hypothetical protein H7841_02410 [Magnetospirillum sp. WYHS-4]